MIKASSKRIAKTNWIELNENVCYIQCKLDVVNLKKEEAT